MAWGHPCHWCSWGLRGHPWPWGSCGLRLYPWPGGSRGLRGYPWPVVALGGIHGLGASMSLGQLGP